MVRALRFALEGAAQKPVLSVDFDGTVHSYEWGWQDGTIYGSVVDGFFEWLMSVYEQFEVVIFSTRSAEADKLDDMARWCNDQWVIWRHSEHGDNDAPEQIPVSFSADKPKAHVSIDDRTIRFEGKWDARELQPDALAAFKPWTER